MTKPAGGWTDVFLDQMQYAADPAADDTVERIVGAWAPIPEGATREQIVAANGPRWARLEAATRLFYDINNNGALADWKPTSPADPDVAATLAAFFSAEGKLPEWADAAKIRRGEELFVEYGALSCILLFCASLPECYVIPDLAAVLHISGQLEERTDYRVRTTAAMIFPVMMRGGMLAPDGTGIAQVLKVRLIHATIRNLILRANPSAATAQLGANQNVKGTGVVAPAAALVGSQRMTESMFAHGWKLGEDGLPCNQEELAYTLLTFGYVFLRGMRTLGLGLPRGDEEAYLHCWNVVGSILGIRRDLLADTMDESAALFAEMQRRGRADPISPDPRPSLGNALMNAMADSIPVPFVKPFPTLMTRHLCGPVTAKNLGLDGPVPILAHILFLLVFGTARVIDTILRIPFPEFSIARFVTRVVGYQFLMNLLMSQTRPLKLPGPLLNGVNSMMHEWSHDPKAWKWVNTLEDRLTDKGQWQVSPGA